LHLLITGGTGTLGRELVQAASEAGHLVRTMSRKPGPAGIAAGSAHPGGVARESEWATANLATGQGLAEAVAGVDAIIHAASDPRGDRTVDETGTRRLAEAARTSGVPHLVYVSIVGIDRIPFPYYVRKLAAERALSESGAPFSILRATQFHSFIDMLFGRAARAVPLVMPLPAGFHVQSVDVREVAVRLLRALDDGPRGLLPDYGGPERLTARDAARLWKRARGIRKPLVPFPAFDAASAAFRAGYNTLAGDARPEQRGKLSWSDWLARPIATRPY
jgi:uncharacterized protein YbjT (DUF2867 family)